MQTQAGSRKRPAPGTSPMPQQPQSTNQPAFQLPQDTASLNEQFRNQFGNDSFANGSFDPNFFSAGLDGGQPQTYSSSTEPIPTSTSLVRRNTNSQLAPKNPSIPQEQWANTGQDQEWLGDIKEESLLDLNERAAVAKKDAQAKRKQIPPFVLKLWSFLNDNKNTNLIRWSVEGTAFTVLDEDEFARTLIPELFKHNNYASFVRQLNMYGFHKKVGLNANSMKAAEKKTKDPNVYWHEYFRQGREDLLWLIQKPQSKSSMAKRKRGQDQKDQGDSEDERRTTPEAEGQAVTRPRPGGQQDLVTLPRTEVASLRDEIQRLQRQQSVISKMIASLKEQNQQFYRQASEFQHLHDRHENSINAILTFLGTFYNRSLQAGVNLQNMFGNVPQQGSVVDVMDGEFPDTATATNQQLQRYRRPQLLLEGSPVRDQNFQPGRITSAPPSNRNTASPPSRADPHNRVSSIGAQSSTSTPSNRASASPVIKDDAETPNLLGQYPENDEMMALINAANANTPTNGQDFDFSSALNHAQNANGNNPLTPQQRNDMLNFIVSQGQPGASSVGANNALVSPNPPPMPNLEQYRRTQEQLEMLTRLQREQDSKVQDLAGRLTPLSPTGSIPGLRDTNAYGGAGQLGHGADNIAPPSDFDIDAFINSDQSYFDDLSNVQGFDANALGGNQLPAVNQNADDANLQTRQTFGNDDSAGLDFDFGTTATGDEEGGDDLFGDDSGMQADGDGSEYEGGRVESLHSGSEATTSPADNNTAAQVVGASDGAGDEETPTKRQRTRR